MKNIRTFIQKIKEGKIIIRWGNLVTLIFTIIGIITVFKWACIGDWKYTEYKTDLGSYYCKGGAILRTCYTNNKEVYEFYGR